VTALSGVCATFFGLKAQLPCRGVTADSIG
jgi:hypothetical protein